MKRFFAALLFAAFFPTALSQCSDPKYVSSRAVLPAMQSRDEAPISFVQRFAKVHTRDIGWSGSSGVPKKEDLPESVRAANPYPLGFQSDEQFKNFISKLFTTLHNLPGFDWKKYCDVRIVFQGSSVAGESFNKGQPGVKFGKHSDFDIAIVSAGWIHHWQPLLKDKGGLKFYQEDGETMKFHTQPLQEDTEVEVQGTKENIWKHIGMPNPLPKIMQEYLAKEAPKLTFIPEINFMIYTDIHSVLKHTGWSLTTTTLNEWMKKNDKDQTVRLSCPDGSKKAGKETKNAKSSAGPSSSCEKNL